MSKNIKKDIFVNDDFEISQSPEDQRKAVQAQIQEKPRENV